MTDRNFLIFGFATNDHALQKAVWRQLLIACIVMATNTCVWAQDLEKGRIEFLSKCAGCHVPTGGARVGRAASSKLSPPPITQCSANVANIPHSQIFSIPLICRRLGMLTPCADPGDVTL
jgi:hypothetical protein